MNYSHRPILSEAKDRVRLALTVIAGEMFPILRRSAPQDRVSL
jgi:hypothetical protein